MQVSASYLVGALPVSDVSKRKRKRPLSTAKEQLPEKAAKQSRTLLSYGFHKDVALAKFVVRLDNTVVSSDQPESQKSTHTCPRCPFTTSHGPALTSHMTKHRILGMEDGGVGALLKHEHEEVFDEWLENVDNWKEWSGSRIPAWRKRGLLTLWFGVAWERVCRSFPFPKVSVC